MRPPARPGIKALDNPAIVTTLGHRTKSVAVDFRQRVGRYHLNNHDIMSPGDVGDCRTTIRRYDQGRGIMQVGEPIKDPHLLLGGTPHRRPREAARVRPSIKPRNFKPRSSAVDRTLTRTASRDKHSGDHGIPGAGQGGKGNQNTSVCPERKLKRGRDPASVPSDCIHRTTARDTVRCRRHRDGRSKRLKNFDLQRAFIFAATMGATAATRFPGTTVVKIDQLKTDLPIIILVVDGRTKVPRPTCGKQSRVFHLRHRRG